MKFALQRSLWVTVAVGLGMGCGAARANDIYIAQNAAGANSGQDCANAYAVAFFNTPGNWGSRANQIGPGTRVHLCGTFIGTAGANLLTAQGDGTNGQPVTILFEIGAGITSPVCGGNSIGCLSIQHRNNIIVDGGTPCGTAAGGVDSSNTCNGFIQNTDNGTGKGHSQSSYLIEAGDCKSCEIRNLGLYDTYDHTSASDIVDHQSLTAIHANSGGSVSIHDNLVHDCGWCITGPVTTQFTLYNNRLYNIEHGLGYGTGGGSASNYGNVFIHDNHFGSMVNWDMVDGGAHHDSIHIWGQQGGADFAGPLYIYNNQFDGDSGATANARIYLEEAVSNAWIFNNVFIAVPGRVFPSEICQCNKAPSVSTNKASYNNTVIGGGFTGGGVNVIIADSANGAESFTNNILQGQSTLMYFQAGTPASSGFLTNIYENTTADGSGSFNIFTFQPGNDTTTLAGFQALLPASSGKDAGSQFLPNTAMRLDSQGRPLAGSPVTGAGTNLTSLCSGNLAPLCKDKAGNPRAVFGPWDIGAYASGVVPNAPNMPNPPTNLSVRVN